MAELSPMMQQYLDIKSKNPNSILFFRLGDFYEMFFEDAELVSKELDLTLTGKSCGLEIKAPMCGIPVKALDFHLSRLVSLGYKVAICEQTTLPVAGKIVQREVVRIVTPGTVFEEDFLDKKQNNFLSCLFASDKKVGFAYCDVSTGETFSMDLDINKFENEFDAFLARINPSEILTNSKGFLLIEKFSQEKLFNKKLPVQIYENKSEETAESLIKNQYTNSNTNYKEHEEEKKQALAMLVSFLFETQKKSLENINSVTEVNSSKLMVLDASARKNLEIVETTQNKSKVGSLLHLLDKTQTSMGGRLIRKWLDQPLCDELEISIRQKGVNDFYLNNPLREEISKTLSKFCDIERLCGKISANRLTPKDCITLVKSLEIAPVLKENISNMKSKIVKNAFDIIEDYSPICQSVYNCIEENAINEFKNSNYIKQGFNAELDELRMCSDGGKELLAKIEQRERERTGIKNLKVLYNRVYGYFIEVNKSQSDLIPFDYIRKQTIANNERYVTEELKELENKILSNQELAVRLEQEIFNQLKIYLTSKICCLQKLSKVIAVIDCLVSFATVSVKHNFVMPKVSESIQHIKILEGRHPVVEAINSNFVPNDVYLNTTTDRTAVITGPNMAGKSTYMRQVALITFMAHTGCFVPAKSAEISLTDRIFTRVGASDDMVTGQSTFMIEMNEVATIVKNATSKSLLILDEIGRGTATFDGLSIAWSIMEYITKEIKAKTLFSTHFHELTELEEILEGVKNYKVTVKEVGDRVLFLRKVLRGGTNKSFGLEVARLAGLPDKILIRTKEILENLEKNNTSLLFPVFEKNEQIKKMDNNKIANDIFKEINEIDIMKVSPLIAFDILAELVKKTKS